MCVCPEFLHTGPITFVTGYLFKDVYMGNFESQRWCFCLEQRASMLTTHYKIFGFPKVRVPLSLHNPLHMQGSCDCLLASLREQGLREVE